MGVWEIFPLVAAGCKMCFHCDLGWALIAQTFVILKGIF